MCPWNRRTPSSQAIARALAQTYPENIDSTAFAVPLQQDLTRNVRTSFLLLLTAAALVLLIACANVAGLLVTRGAERDREFAVRTALGGSRIQLLRQLLVEGLLLSAGGAVVALVLATRTFDVLETLVPDSLRGALAPTLDLRLLTVALVAVLLTGLVFGLVPLRHALEDGLADTAECSNDRHCKRPPSCAGNPRGRRGRVGRCRALLDRTDDPDHSQSASGGSGISSGQRPDRERRVDRG